MAAMLLGTSLHKVYIRLMRRISNHSFGIPKEISHVVNNHNCFVGAVVIGLFWSPHFVKIPERRQRGAYHHCHRSNTGDSQFAARHITRNTQYLLANHERGVL